MSMWRKSRVRHGGHKKSRARARRAKLCPELHNNISYKMNTIQQCKEILIEYEQIEFAYVFGSFAKGEETKGSDLDIAINVSENLSLDEYLGLKVKLEKACKREVDLVILNETGTLLKREINLNHRLIFSRNDELESNHRVKVVFEYTDFKKYIDMFYEKTIDRIREEVETRG